MNTIALLPSEEIIELVKSLKKRGFTDIWFALSVADLLSVTEDLSSVADLLAPVYEEALAECGIVDEEAQQYLNGRLDFPEVVQDKVDGWLQSIWDKVGE